MKLSILIATIQSRSDMFEALKDKFTSLVNGREVEILSESDSGELSIGMKRQLLLEKATGEWIVYFDDDDWPYEGYIDNILHAIDHYGGIDCMGINGVMTTDGKRPKRWCHRLGYPIAEGAVARRYGFDYLRPIIHFNPVKRDKALQAGFADMRFGEDMDYAKRLNPLLVKEFYIQEPLFHYRYCSLIPHNEKYGVS